MKDIIITLLLATTVLAVFAAPSSKISGSLSSKLNDGTTANIFVKLASNTKTVIDFVHAQNLATRGERLSALKFGLQQHASVSQSGVLEYLKEYSLSFKSFWITNQVYVQAATSDVIESLAQLPEVESIREEVQVNLHPIKTTPQKNFQARQEELAWGIQLIQAHLAWNITNGTGVVVAHTDSGVRYTHEALRDSYLDNGYAWYDPLEGREFPYDEEIGHGTHTMGTIMGSKGIGVAPGAKWMSCQACPTYFNCPESAFIVCSEWMTCPTRWNGTDPDCSKAPNIVSNSWGWDRGQDYFKDIADAWIAGGIIPVFSQGNSGPSCATANSPGDLDNVIGVGATTREDQIATFSSLGPSVDGRIKPDVSAPGQDVWSATPWDDASYGYNSGTSMAGPHVAGVAALMLSVNPGMSYAELADAIRMGVDTSLNSRGQECGGIADTVFPNHVFGYGRINALKSVEAALEARRV